MKSILAISIPIISFCVFRLIIEFNKKRKKERLLINLGSKFFIDELNRIIEENKYNLLDERRRLKEIDPYGNENLDKWFGNPPIYENLIHKNILEGSTKFKEGIPYFWLNVIVKKFDGVEIFFKKWNYYKLKNPLIEDEIIGIRRKLNINDWYLFVASLVEKSCNKLSSETKVNSKNSYEKGLKFEDLCFQKLRLQGWEVKQTPVSGDQGVDLIASIDDLRLCIQCKDHEKAIGNKAVQEIYSGKKYWLGTHAILISRSGYTKSAQKLALSSKVILINESEIENIKNIIY
tara:strand:- start:14 stop:883 length:870 start_codon:yes stop_codon:yes gene_type:complete